ncbi:A24 family peptidase [Ectobacillus sp. JY-23]|uniref:prepilin peptidase n=1 Tax=Ectobacillus sp. JY-23 TaxID=2933872 RepID=UPI00248B6EEC|nr:A24 family peptidase [Ectobacillus sp. JY-23]
MIGLYAYVFVVGLVLGSFYNVVGMRVPVGKSIVSPRSACTRCGHKLGARELVPVLSYFWQKGKCRGCGGRISPIYAVFELLTGVLFIYAFYAIGWDAELFIAWALISLLMIIVVSDLSYMLIPNKIVLVFLAVFIGLLPFSHLIWWEHLLGAALGFGLLLAIAMISKGGMGGGDVKLFGLLGFVLGPKMVLLAFMLSAFYGTVFGLIGLWTGHVQRGKPMPFGPFIMLGTLTAYFFGVQLLELYFSLF